MTVQQPPTASVAPTQPRSPGAEDRIDVVVDVDPRSGCTDPAVTVYVNGVRTAEAGVHVHVLDPGAASLHADHEWLTRLLEDSDSLPAAVRAEVARLARDYHAGRYCPHPDC